MTSRCLSEAFWALEQDPDAEGHQDYALAAAWYRVLCDWDPDRGHEPYQPTEEIERCSEMLDWNWYHKHSEDGPVCTNWRCAESSTWPPQERPAYEGRIDWYRLPIGTDPRVDAFMAKYPKAAAERSSDVVVGPKDLLEGAADDE